MVHQSEQAFTITRSLPGLWEMVLKTNKYVPATKIATHCIIAALTTHLLQNTAA